MSREFALNEPNAPGDNRVGRETGRRSDTANTPYCQSPVNTLPPVRTGDGQIFSEATQQVHGRRRSRRMVGTACISLLSCPCGRFLPIPEAAPVIAGSSGRTTGSSLSDWTAQFRAAPSPFSSRPPRTDSVEGQDRRRREGSAAVLRPLSGSRATTSQPRSGCLRSR